MSHAGLELCLDGLATLRTFVAVSIVFNVFIVFNIFTVDSFVVVLIFIV